jgi:hypothetical protein
MTPAELRRLQAMHRLESRSTSQAMVAAELGISTRQVKRLWRAYKRDAERGILSGHRGHPANRKRDPAIMQNALVIIRDNYVDFGPQLASEKLLERHGIRINKESLRQAMIGAGIWKAHPRRRNYHPPRERRPRFGELIQIDGSPHKWFENRGPKCTLIVFIDDATSRIVSLHFAEGETTAAYFIAAKQYFERFGLPLALYSDQLRVFRLNLPTTESDTTQFGRAMEELNIELICANSPQAKGRVERANRTLQDRLVKELRLANINCITDANTFLTQYIFKHNDRFAVEPRSAEDAHRPIAWIPNLDTILASRNTRKLTKDLLFQYNNCIYQITTKSRRLAFACASVDIIDMPDGSMVVERHEQRLEFELLRDKRTAPIVSSKALNSHLDGRVARRGETAPKKAHTPARNHPWRLPKKADPQLALARPNEDISKLLAGDI